MKKYFHELTDAEFEQAVKEKKTYADFLQPDWCGYPNALAFNVGCWALTERRIKRLDDCKYCERCKYRVSEKKDGYS